MYLSRHFGRSTKKIVVAVVSVCCFLIIMSVTFSNKVKRSNNTVRTAVKSPFTGEGLSDQWHNTIARTPNSRESGDQSSRVGEDTNLTKITDETSGDYKDVLPQIRFFPVLVGKDGLPLKDLSGVFTVLNRLLNMREKVAPESELIDDEITDETTKLLDKIMRNIIAKAPDENVLRPLKSTLVPSATDTEDRYAGKKTIPAEDEGINFNHSSIVAPTKNISALETYDDSPHAEFDSEESAGVDLVDSWKLPLVIETDARNESVQEDDGLHNTTHTLPLHLSIVQQAGVYKLMPIKTNRLLHIKPHPYVLNVKNMCGPDEDVYILTIVMSIVTGFETRQSIRETWGSVTEARGEPMKLVFLLGTTQHDPNNTIQNRLINEHEKYHDIIQGSFIDAYRNLTLKTFYVLKWARTFCPRAKYVMKADDDIYVNFESMVIDLKLLPPKNLYMGKLQSDSRPIRKPGKKWFAPWSSYSDEYYPDYMCGPGYIMSMDVVKKMYEEAKNIPYFFVEDVWIGLIAKRLQIPMVMNYRFVVSAGIARTRSVVPRMCPYSLYNVLHKLTPDQYRYLFEKCNKSRTRPGLNTIETR